MRLTIKTKLIGSFGAVLALLGTAGYFGISSLSASNAMMQRFAERPFVQVNNAKDIATGVVDLRRLMFRMYLESDPVAFEKLAGEYEGRWGQIETSLERFVSAIDPSRQSEVADVKPAIDSLRQVSDKGIPMFREVNVDLSDVALVETGFLFDKLVAELNALSEDRKSVV